MHVLNTILENKKSYRRCVMSDVFPHYRKIKQWIPEPEMDHFKERMADCVEDETAWCLNDSFLYYKKADKRIAHGVALSGYENTLDILTLFVGVFTYEDPETCIMRFTLHPEKMMEEYRTMLTEVSMQRTHKNRLHPLMIRVDAFRNKFAALMDLHR